MEKPKIVLIDGSGYIFRAFYAISRLSTSKGFPTNAVYGFIAMLARVLEIEKPKFLAIAFDTAKPTFRKDRYADYKANRSAPPEDLVKQIPYIMRSVEAFGICSLIQEGFEADDLLGTIASHAEKEGFTVEIITGDKDLMQLVTPNITLYDTMKERRYDGAGVKEKLGVRPDQVADLLALMGDSSDNIPGVTGIGEKTACELLGIFDTLDGIYAGLGNIKSEKRRETLKEEREIAYLSRELATIKRDVMCVSDMNLLAYRGPVREKLKALFEELEFQNFLKKFELQEPSKVRRHYQTILTVEELGKIVDLIRSHGRVSVDTETTSLSPRLARVVGISLAIVPGQAAYIPIGHHVPGDPGTCVPGQLDEATVRENLRPVLEDASIKKIGQNLKYDVQILRGWGITLSGIVSDTLVTSYLLEPEQPHNLDALALRYLNHHTIKYSDVTGTGRSQIPFSEVSIDQATAYSGEDADVALQLHEKLEGMLQAIPSLASLYQEIELPLVSVLARMEYEGVGVDRERLVRMGVDLTRELGEVEKSIFELAGDVFNINSTKQVSDVLFGRLKLPPGKKTKTGFSTDESVLVKLANDHAIVRQLLRYRELGKLKSTYVDGLLGQISSETGRIHTHYNQAVTATGRLSSSDPNLQNIPANEDPKYDLRSVFVAGPGRTLLSADYSQVELRLLAHMSRDEELMRAFSRDEDVHERTARLIFGNQTVTPEQRRIAKTINFGVMYGQTPFGLSQMLAISLSEARQFIERYFSRYRGVRSFLDSLVTEARSRGYAESLLGRRRFIAELSSQNRVRREMAERAAINTPIQGTAADLIKRAMLRIERAFIDEKIRGQMILQVHDELVVEILGEDCDRAILIVKDCMENAMSLDVALKVDLGWGKNWRECG